MSIVLSTPLRRIVTVASNHPIDLINGISENQYQGFLDISDRYQRIDNIKNWNGFIMLEEIPLQMRPLMPIEWNRYCRLIMNNGQLRKTSARWRSLSTVCMIFSFPKSYSASKIFWSLILGVDLRCVYAFMGDQILPTNRTAAHIQALYLNLVDFEPKRS